MLNPVRPPPSKLGSLYVCDASEREIWTTKGTFKVGDATHPPAENRTKCPCYDGENCRRQPLQNGKLDFAQSKICGIFIRKLMPSSGSNTACSKWMNAVAKNTNGRAPGDCSTRFNPDSTTAPTPKTSKKPTKKPVQTRSPTSPAKPGSYMNIRQKVACDICMNTVSDCSKYNPDKNMLNPVRPPPSKLGSLYVCSASDREVWTTTGTFKIGDAAHLPAENRPKCPCYEGQSCNRQQLITGKKDFAQTKICEILRPKLMPSTASDADCSKWMNTVVSSSQGSVKPGCSQRFDYNSSYPITIATLSDYK